MSEGNLLKGPKVPRKSIKEQRRGKQFNFIYEFPENVSIYS